LKQAIDQLPEEEAQLIKFSLYGQSFPGRNSKAHGEKSGIRIAQ